MAGDHDESSSYQASDNQYEQDQYFNDTFTHIKDNHHLGQFDSSPSQSETAALGFRGDLAIGSFEGSLAYSKPESVKSDMSNPELMRYDAGDYPNKRSRNEADKPGSADTGAKDVSGNSGSGSHNSGTNAGNPSSTSGTSGSSGTGKPGNNGLEIKKMTEVKSRACDECRRRKTACYYLNRDNRKCFRCQMENIECTFNSQSRVQAPSSGPNGRVVPIPTRAGARQHPTVPGAVVGPVDDYSQLPGRSLLKKTLSLQPPRSSFAVGQHGLWEQRVLESIALDKSNQARVSPNLSLRKVGPDCWFIIRNEGGLGDWAHDCDEVERLVYPYGRALVNAFFMHFHCEYPILHEKIFVEKYMRTYRELMPALLGAVYLLGMQWWSHHSELVTVPSPTHIIPQLYNLTLANFFKSSGVSSLSLVQAGLLLLQCSYADPRHLSICSVINSAAFRLALNRNCIHWKLPRWEINLRLRLSWATYSQCTWICLFDSIPPLIQDESWFLSLLNPDIFDTGANEPSQNGALFIQLSKLSLIVHDMHNLLSSKLLLMYSSELSASQAIMNNANSNQRYQPPGATSPRNRSDSDSSTAGVPGTVSGSDASDTSAPSAAGNTSTDKTRSGADPGSADISAGNILELIKRIQLQLHDWYSNVPPALLSLDGDEPTGNFSLRVAYISAEVVLHRFIIRVVSSSSSTLSPEMMRLLRSTARERLDVAYALVKSLKPRHLQQFWYFASSSQFAVIGVFAALMYTTSDTKAEAEYYWTLLREYIGQLQLYVENDVIGAALRTLRSSIAGVPGLVF